MKIVVGRDKLDEVQVSISIDDMRDTVLIWLVRQGVRHKIKAFEMFLDKYPDFQQKVYLASPYLPIPLTILLAGRAHSSRAPDDGD